MNALTATTKERVPVLRSSLPRGGFLGLRWIGGNRMEAIARSGGLVDIVPLGHVASGVALDAARALPHSEVVQSFDDLLEKGLKGLAIATPSALHAEQAMHALARGVAVFCKKPPGRNEKETAVVIEAVRRANRLAMLEGAVCK